MFGVVVLSVCVCALAELIAAIERVGIEVETM